MKKYKTIILITILLALNLNRSMAAVSITIDDGVGSPLSVDITPGDDFSFSIYLNSTQEFLTGLTYFFTISNNGSGKFSITGRDMTGSPYNDPTTPDVTSDSSGPLLDPINDVDLGAGVLPSPGLGSLFVANFTIQSDPTVPLGTYTLFITNTDVVDDSEDFNSVPHTIDEYTINVIPEPTVALLVGIAGLLGVAFRRRRFI